MIHPKETYNHTGQWEVIPNPDRPNVLTECGSGQCQTKSYAVRHHTGGIIRFYQGRTMTRYEAEKLKNQLNMNRPKQGKPCMG